MSASPYLRGGGFPQEGKFLMRISSLRSALAAVALAGGLALSAPSSASAESPGGSPSFDELVFCAVEGTCLTVQDTQRWALSTAAWRYPAGTQADGVGDAFRHCIWAGALANRVGYESAYTQTLGHENYTAESEGAFFMDVSNDFVGLDLGVRSLSEGGSDTWGWIMNQCGALADSGQLYGPFGVLGGY